MSRSRHKARASGGSVKVYAGGDSNVMKEARERKHGGAVKGEGDAPKGRKDKAMRGYVKPGRARGGSVGADKHPLSSAANVKKLPGEE